MVEIEARNPGDQMPSREAGVELEAAVPKAGAPDPRAAECAARMTVARTGVFGPSLIPVRSGLIA
jgi:hypothetical protein